MGIISKNFVAEVQSGKHVFGSPGAYIKEAIKEKDAEIRETESVQVGEFFMQNKNLRAELASLKAKRVALEAAGDYFLGLMNKCLNEPWKNSILFCNVSFRGKNGFTKKDNFSEKPSDSIGDIQDNNFISQKELSLLMNIKTENIEDDFEYEDEPIYDFVFQTRYGTFFINIQTAATSMEVPIFVLDGTCSSPNSMLFNCSEATENFKYPYYIYDIIYNKTGALVLKNENWEENKVLHISEFKKEIEKVANQNGIMSNIERYKHLDLLYKSYYHEEESDFTKNINKNLK